MAAEAQRHYRDPGLYDLAGKHVRDGWALAEVHLGRLAGGKVQQAGGLGVRAPQLAHPAPNG